MSQDTECRATFTSMENSTSEDWVHVLQAARAYRSSLPERVLQQLRLLEDDHGGLAVNRLEHCLQAASRAYRDDRDEEYVVCALLHDIGDLVCPTNHADMAAAMLRPYVSQRNHWLVANHTVFQGYYYFHHLSANRFAREVYRGHPDFEYTAQFCELYDQNSFDPKYDSMPLSAFSPMVSRLLETPRNMPSYMLSSAVT